MVRYYHLIKYIVERGGCSGLHAPISKAEGTALFKEDVAEYESCVCALDNTKYLNANQYGALVSFAYNSGCGGVKSGWHGAMAKKNFKGIYEALPTTNTLGSELSSHHKKESAFCSKATAAKSGCKLGNRYTKGSIALYDTEGKTFLLYIFVATP